MKSDAGELDDAVDVWSPLELLDQETLDALHLSKLKQQLAYVAERSTFYRDRFARSGFAIDKLKSIRDLARLPLLEKSAIRESVSEHPPLGDHLCADSGDIAQVQSSSGTTGKPSYIALTRRDVEDTAEMTARALYSGGFRPGDTILHALSMSRGFVGGLPMSQSIAHLGATILPIGAESGVDRLLGTINDLRPTGVIGAPSFIGYMAEQSERVLGKPASDLGIRLVMVGSEPGGGLPGTRDRLQALWNAPVREMYGLSDLGCSFWSEGPEGAGMHFTGQGILHYELIDPNTGEAVPREKGATGELVFTSLTRQAMPLIRFRTRDHVEIVETRPAHGRKGIRMRVLGRTDDMLIWRGVNLYPSAVQEIINQLKPLTTGLFKIVLDFEGHSTSQPLRIRVETTSEDKELAARRVSDEIKNRLLIGVVVEAVPPGTFESPGARKPVLIERVAPRRG